MKVQELLIEKIESKATVTPLEVKAAIKLLNKHCRSGLEAIQQNRIMYRGVAERNKNDLELLDASTLVRTSRDSNNIYQLMMDSSSALKDYPSRSNSLICATDIFTANEYADLPRAIFPFDDVKVVACKVLDFLNEAEIHLFDYVCELDEFTRGLADFLNVTRKKKFTNIKELDNIAAKDPEGFINTWTHVWGNGNHSISELELKKLDPKKMITQLSSIIMTPENLRLSLSSPGEVPRGVECWFSGKAVSMSQNMLGKIIQELRKQGVEIDHDVDMNLDTD